MRKVTIFLCLIFIPLLLAGCTNKIFEQTKTKVSEMRGVCYIYQDDNITAKFDSGTRENVYKIDGVSGEKTNFGVLTFYLKNDPEISVEPQYVLLIGTTRLDGKLERSPFDGSYVADTGRLVGTGASIVAKFVAGDINYECTLSCPSSEWEINGEQALEIACRHFEKDLKKHIAENDLKCEIYVRALTDDEYSDKYYWYVNFFCLDTSQFTCIIDINTGEILADRGVLR